jgi:hypothetical protein
MGKLASYGTRGEGLFCLSRPCTGQLHYLPVCLPGERPQDSKLAGPRYLPPRVGASRSTRPDLSLEGVNPGRHHKFCLAKWSGKTRRALVDFGMYDFDYLALSYGHLNLRQRVAKLIRNQKRNLQRKIMNSSW